MQWLEDAEICTSINFILDLQPRKGWFIPPFVRNSDDFQISRDKFEDMLNQGEWWEDHRYPELTRRARSFICMLFRRVPKIQSLMLIGDGAVSLIMTGFAEDIDRRLIEISIDCICKTDDDELQNIMDELMSLFDEELRKMHGGWA